jgi:hypothetical protein
VRRIALLTTLATLAALPLATADAKSRAETPPADFVLPGYWEMTSVLDVVMHDTKTERVCVKPEDVAKFMTPCNHHYECEYPTHEVGNGHITLQGRWVGKKDKQVVDVKGAGVYTPTTMHASAEMHTKLMGLPLGGTATSDAHRISAECPVGAKNL